MAKREASSDVIIYNACESSKDDNNHFKMTNFLASEVKVFPLV